MKKWLRRALWLVLGLLVLLALFVAHTVFFRPLSPRLFYERVFVEFILQEPEAISALGLLPPAIDWTADKLGDYSPAKQARLQAKLKRDLATLREYDRASLADPLSYDALESFLSSMAEGEPYQLHNYPLNQLFGVQNNLPTFMAKQHRVVDLTSARDYIKRLQAFPRVSGEVLQGLEAREKAGIVPPAFVVEKVLAEMRGFVGKPARENILYTALAEHIGKAAKPLTDAERQEVLSQAEAAIQTQVYPAYQRWIDDYAALQPKAQARGNTGAWALPQGEAYYAWEVKRHTTTSMSAEEIHQLGLREVTRIGSEMDAILKAQGLSEGSLGERVRQIGERPDQLYPDTDAGRQQILADYQTMIDRIDAGMGSAFQVRATQPVKVERIPVFKEATSAGAYYDPPAMDGSRPGIFYANLRSVKEIPRFGMRTLAYHEAVPGHHFQLSIQQNLQGVPTFRKLLPVTAYAEGWALYAERLASELGFQPTPLDELGRLQGEMFRAVRLVVDTGMHAKRWSREQAIDYMIEQTGMPQTDVVAEIERYLVNPGQALAYKMGMNVILDLREEARRELGDRFQLARFHDTVLTGGALPMPLLQQRVRAWIAQEKNAPRP
jgi:uncharacterized protein (DUF885 family)